MPLTSSGTTWGGLVVIMRGFASGKPSVCCDKQDQSDLPHLDQERERVVYHLRLHHHCDQQRTHGHS